MRESYEKLLVTFGVFYLFSVIFLSLELPFPNQTSTQPKHNPNNILNININNNQKYINNDINDIIIINDINSNIKTPKKVEINEDEVKDTIDRLINALYAPQRESIAKKNTAVDLTLLNIQTNELLNELIKKAGKNVKNFQSLSQFIPLPSYSFIKNNEKEFYSLPLERKFDFTDFRPNSDEISIVFEKKYDDQYLNQILNNNHNNNNNNNNSNNNNDQNKINKNYCEVSPAAKMIFYNRIGKAGSSSLKSWISSFKENFQISSSDLYDGKSEHLSGDEEKIFVENFQEFYLQKQNFYERHVHFVNFTKYNFDQPFFINMMREPGDRYISQFYFWRTMKGDFGDDLRSRNLTVIDCIMRSNEEIYGCPLFNYQTSFFCGNSPQCKIPADETTFLLARKNLLNFYWVVGTLERFNETTKLLEKTLPTYFPSNSLHSQKKFHLLQNSYEKPPPEVYYMSSVANHYDLILYNLVNDLMDVHLSHCFG